MDDNRGLVAKFDSLTEYLEGFRISMKSGLTIIGDKKIDNPEDYFNNQREYVEWLFIKFIFSFRKEFDSIGIDFDDFLLRSFFNKDVKNV